MLVCLFCGDTRNSMTKEQIKRFGEPTCCESRMIEIDETKAHAIIKGLDKVKVALEKEILRGSGCEQYLDGVKNE